MLSLCYIHWSLLLLLLRLYCRALNRPVFSDWIFGNIPNHTALLLVAPNPPIRANGPDPRIIIDCRADIRIGKFISRSVAGCMDHFRNTLGPARRPGSARPTNSSVPLRTLHLRFIHDRSIGIVSGPHAGDRRTGVQFSTPAENVFFPTASKPNLCPTQTSV